MFISKINGISKIGFKGYQHVKNDVGESIMKFNYPYDSDKETCEVHIYKAVPDSKYNYKLSDEPIAKINLKPEGVNVNLQDITDLDKDAPFAYKIVRKDKNTGKVIWEGADTGAKMKQINDGYGFRLHQDKANTSLKDAKGNSIKGPNGQEYSYEISDFRDDSVKNYTHSLVSRKGTTPTVQGAAYLAMPDSFMPGAMYRGFNESNTGEIYVDKDYQKKMEGVIKTFSNSYDGSIAGLQKGIPYLKQQGYKILFSTPIANGDDVSAHSYWNKNNMQIASKMGNTENFNSFMKDLYKNGMKYVYDGTFTSEGLEGIHFQYALRWADKNPQSFHWFRMNGLKDNNLGLGIVPQNKENLRHRVVNAPYNYELQANGTYKKVANPNYNPDKETLVQLYDASQVTEGQVAKLDKVIKNYDNLTSGKELDINSHDDTLINYVFQIDPKEYQARIDVINDLNKNQGKNLRLDSPDGTIMACEFSNFKIDKKTEGGFVTWDANTDMVKMNYHISGYDEKLLQAIPDLDMRAHERELIERGSKEVQDMAIQAGKYWTSNVKDAQTMYTAQTIGGAKTVEGIKKLIEEEKLPKEAGITNEGLNNILNGQYMLSPKGILPKDDVTVKALMKLPLDALEFGENTVGVLSTSYFSNRATTDDTIGVSRFDLMKQNNPHLVKEYAHTYNKVNALFQNEIKDFADKIINKVDTTSNEKLLDKNGDYTEYGEYVMDLVGKEITKYAMLKALAGDNLKTKLMGDNQITYDYEALKEGTTLKALGINAHSPEDEASQLEKKFEHGLKKLSDADVNYVADSISKQIDGTDTSSFRLAEAIVDRAGLGLDWRLDAAKDVMDMDAIRNEDNDFDDTWNDVIQFWGKFVQGVKENNPNSYIVAEITDVPQLIQDTTGSKVWPNGGNTDIGGKFNGEPDAMVKFFNETGITSEAGYSYFYTDLLTHFSKEFERGQGYSQNHDSLKNRFDLLLETRNIDYLRNLYTFMGNHDKPRMIHCLALDMGLFHNVDNKRQHALDSMQILSGAKSIEEMPIEFRLNVDNKDYMRTVSTRAVAMSKLLSQIVNEDLKGVATDDDIKNINQALVDLANGNYLGEGQNINYQTINIKELSSLDNAFATILNMAENHGLNLTETERKNLIADVVKNANQMNFDKYLVHGDFDWTSLDDKTSNENFKAGVEILGDKGDFSGYSLYTVQLARLLKDSYLATGKNVNDKKAILAGMKDFAEKYNRETVKNATTELPKYEDTKISMRKNAYAARDFKTAISMAIKQAEFNTGKEIANKEQIVDTVYKSATEPAVAKASMIMESLGGLFGNPTMYGGDEFGMTGYEEKAKNVYLQNRNALPWSELEEDNLIGGYRNSVKTAMNGALSARSNPELHALNDGTPYALDVQAHGRTREKVQERLAEIYKELDANPSKAEKDILEKEKRELTKDLAKLAYMMQSANGDITVTLMNAGEIEHDSRVDYFKKYGINNEADRKKFFAENNIESINPDNRYVPIQPKSEMDSIVLGSAIALPVGTVFMNANARDKAKYVVNEFGNIVKEGGGKIVMDGLTSKNGVMILRHLKKVAFKGKQHKTYFNPQYNFVSKPYQKSETVEEGQKLSIISK